MAREKLECPSCRMDSVSLRERGGDWEWTCEYGCDLDGYLLCEECNRLFEGDARGTGLCERCRDDDEIEDDDSETE
jgi:hypothetical protein